MGSCMTVEKNVMCSDDNLVENGTTWLVLVDALSNNGVDTTIATIGDLTCSGRRLAPVVRRLDTVDFSLDFVASFADVSAANSFASSVNAVREEVKTSFEILAVAQLGFNVTVPGVMSLDVTDNSDSSSSGVDQTNIFSVVGAVITASLF